jgi:hypothetical protein
MAGACLHIAGYHLLIAGAYLLICKEEKRIEDAIIKIKKARSPPLFLIIL